MVFYDLTTVRIHGEARLEDDLRLHGMNKESGGIARQFVLGVVQSAEGLPLMHTVHPGNVADVIAEGKLTHWVNFRSAPTWPRPKR